jgi:hypothetical protein
MTAICDSKRTCTKCNTAFPATSEFFHAYKRAPDGCRAVCRKCRAEDHQENRSERLEKRRAHYQENKQRLILAVKVYYAKNSEAQRLVAARRHRKNRDHNLERMRGYRAKNLDALNSRKRVKARQTFAARYGTDLEFTLNHRTKSLVKGSLAAGTGGKRLKQLLGYSIEDLKTHIEKQFHDGMTWARFMGGEIHLDHIIPISFFKPTTPDSEEFKACWALSNLRPMWAKENLSKGARITQLI